LPDLEGEIELEILKAIVYGLGKAEAEIVGEPNIFSKLAYEEAGKWWLERMGAHGLVRKEFDDPIKAFKEYIELMEKGNLFQKDDIKVEKVGDNVIVVTGGIKCPFREACEKLAEEGFKEHGCPLIGPFIRILKDIGFSVGYTIKTEVKKPCTIRIEYIL